MPWWSNLWKRKPPKPPLWSGFVNPEQYDRFEELVIDALQQRAIMVDRTAIRSGGVLLSNGGIRPVEWILQDLGRDCANCDEKEWPSRIQQSLYECIGLQGVHSSSVIQDPKPIEEDILFRLRIQLYHNSYLQKELPDTHYLISHPLTEDLSIVLVQDLGNIAETTVSRHEANRWMKSDLELLTLGKRNTLVDIKEVTLQPYQTASGFMFDVVISNKSYLGGCMLMVLERMESPGGFLVGILSWHHWIVYEINESTPLTALVEMGEEVRKIYNQLEVRKIERLSPHLFWFQKKSGFTTIRFQEENGIQKPILPDALRLFLQ